MTNTHGMLQAFFGAKAGEIAGQVVSVGDLYADVKGCQGFFAPTGAQKEIWDWRTIRLLAKRVNLFGRSGTLAGHRVVMLWGDPPGWEAMLVEVLGLLGIGRQDGVLVIVGNARQFVAGDFMA
jgi:hypothetical protein